jgi:hypothetical protein
MVLGCSQTVDRHSRRVDRRSHRGWTRAPSWARGEAGYRQPAHLFPGSREGPPGGKMRCCPQPRAGGRRNREPTLPDGGPTLPDGGPILPLDGRLKRVGTKSSFTRRWTRTPAQGGKEQGAALSDGGPALPLDELFAATQNPWRAARLRDLDGGLKLPQTRRFEGGPQLPCDGGPPLAGRVDQRSQNGGLALPRRTRQPQWWSGVARPLTSVSTLEIRSTT